ncbi:metallophosphoesterase family protein [Alicyclobacillus macrosporangiidus]|uniref:metallophosphoesterase family protein n=1 Tax=Alicyclobacillus macrosporangiidus TaxID=392015 RepID=UPI002481D4DB|nr:metallophosphoesterase family protein [Alicyclobacillus macrosporangiidus]
MRGNTDRYVAERYGVVEGLDPWDAKINRWCADEIDDTQREFIKNFSDSISIEIYGLGPTLFVHGSPRRDDGAIRQDTPELELVPMLEGVVEDLVVCGHTHVQFDRTVCGKRIVNPGSVGLQIGARGACWALLGPDVRLRQTMYDFEEAAERIRQTGAPNAEQFAQHILMPPIK